MDENKKRDCDVIKHLEEENWRRIAERHRAAWRAAFALWAALGAFIVIALTNQGIFTKSNLPVTLAGVIVIGGVLCILHWCWLKGLGDANALDRDVAIHYGVILRELSASEFPKPLQDRLDAQKKKLEAFRKDWSRSKQFLVTVIFYVIAISVVLLVSLASQQIPAT